MLNKDEFEFFDSPPISINKRTRSRARQLYELYELSINIYELSASDYTLSLLIRLHERLWTLSIFIYNLFNLFQIYLTSCNIKFSLPTYQSSTIPLHIHHRLKAWNHLFDCCNINLQIFLFISETVI